MSMFDPVSGWKDTAAYPGRGQRAPEKSISDTEMYSGSESWGNMLVWRDNTQFTNT